jgi:putative transposase
MPHLAPPSLKLTPAEREQLTQLVNRHSTPQQIALRANIVLLADQGLNHRGIMDHLNISRDMARLWRNRWLELSAKNKPVLDRLADLVLTYFVFCKLRVDGTIDIYKIEGC